MGKPATKAADSVFYQARIKASAFNENLSSREGASEETGIERTRLARIELGSLVPYPEEVLLMADAYKAPELLNHYCRNCCPIGKRIAPAAEVRDLDRLTIKLVCALEKSEDVRSAMLQIAHDGNVTKDEEGKFMEVSGLLEQLATIAQEIKIWAAKNL